MEARGGHRRAVWARRTCALEMGRESRLGAAGSGSERVHISVWISLADFDMRNPPWSCSAATVPWGGENTGCNHARLALGVTLRHAPTHAGRTASSSTARGAERALWSLSEGHGAVRAAIDGRLGARAHLPTINGCTCAPGMREYQQTMVHGTPMPLRLACRQRREANAWCPCAPAHH
jgi:hypothetical protein